MNKESKGNTAQYRLRCIASKSLLPNYAVLPK